MPNNPFNVNDIIGLTPQEALVMLAKHDINAVRVTLYDNIPNLCTRDYRTDRMNVEVVAGKISMVQGIG